MNIHSTLTWARSCRRLDRCNRFHVGFLALLLGCSVAPGCANFQEASPLRQTRTTEVATIPADAWPARSLEAAEDLHDQLGETEILVRRRIFRAGQDLRTRDMKAVCSISGKAVIGQGLLLDVIAPVQRFEPPNENDTLAADPSSNVRTPATVAEVTGDVVLPAPPGTPTVRSLVFISFPPDAANISPLVTKAGFGEMGVYFDVSTPPATTPLRGIVVHFHGLGGTEYEQPVIDKLLASGFVVLSGDFPWNRWRPLTGTADTLGDVHRLSRAIAQITEDALSEAAYAAEAATLYMQHHEPGLADCPVVMLGFSAGSLVTPTAAARLGDRCSAMVLVASGCNLVAIAQESELTNGGIRVMRLGERINGAMSGLLYGTYLSYSKLDPWHTALACRRLPVLMVQGRSDTIVPTTCGDELFERLNAPDVLSYPGGHRTVFFALPSASGRIQSWVSDQTSPTRLAHAPAAQPAIQQTDPHGQTTHPGSNGLHTVVPGLAR